MLPGPELRRILIVGSALAALVLAGCDPRTDPSDGGQSGDDAGTDAGPGELPETVLTGGPSGSTSSTTASFTFTGSPEGVTFECSLDGAAFTACSSPAFTSVSEGEHTFSVRAVSAAGRDATPEVRTWTVDTTAPESAITVGPPSIADAGTADFAFAGNESGATLECAVDEGALAACTSPVTQTLPEGEHTFRVRATDAAGNVEPEPAVWSWRIDLTPPQTTLEGAPTGTTTSTSASIVFDASEPVQRFECRLNGAAFAPCTSPHALSALADGDYTFEVRAVDVALHTDPTPAAASWTVDTVVPDTTLRTFPAAITSDTEATFTFDASRAGVSFECQLDSAAFAACTSPKTITVTEGPHTFSVRAVHPLTGTDPSPAAFSWTVDLTPPQTTIDSGAPSGATNATSASIVFSADEPTLRFECRLDASAFAPCTSPHALSGLTDGDHTFQVRALDLAQNVDATPASASWSVDTAVPQTTLQSGPDTVTTETEATFTFDASRVDVTFECQLDGASYAACTSPTTLVVAEGSHTFFVRAVHAVAGTDPSSATYPWRVDLTPPDTTLLTKPPAAHTSATATFTFSSSETGSTFECTLDSVTAPCTSPATFSGLTETSHSFSVVAIDAVGLRDATPESWTFSVDLSPVKIRLMAANITSGNNQSYLDHGIRIFQGLDPDIVMIQEFKYGTSTAPELRSFVDTAFGTSFSYFREPATSGIPNGVISRYPIIAAGEWDDTQVSDRDFVWAQIDIPGPVDLYVVSVHLLTAGSTVRNTQATNLRALIQANFPAGAYLAIGGDFNTDSRSEAAIGTISSVVVTSGPYPVDQNGIDGTNASRAKPYDWLLVDTDLNQYATPLVIGSSTRPSGLVFDSRVYTPLSEVSPVLSTDSGVTGMQHMAVLKDFLIPQ